MSNNYLCFLLTTVSKPTIKALQSSKIINAIGPKWYELGIALLDDDQSVQLETIKANHNEATRCCTAMLIYWLQSHSTATWHDLVEALKAPGVELNNVANIVEALFPGKEVQYECILLIIIIMKPVV